MNRRLVMQKIPSVLLHHGFLIPTYCFDLYRKRQLQGAQPFTSLLFVRSRDHHVFKLYLRTKLSASLYYSVLNQTQLCLGFKEDRKANISCSISYFFNCFDCYPTSTRKTNPVRVKLHPRLRLSFLQICVQNVLWTRQHVFFLFFFLLSIEKSDANLVITTFPSGLEGRTRSARQSARFSIPTWNFLPFHLLLNRVD